MPAPYNADLQWRIIWFVHILQNSVAEALFVKGQWNTISKFLVNGDVKPESVGHSYGSISFAQREELIVFAYQIRKPQLFSVDNCHSPFSPTTFFEIGVPRLSATNLQDHKGEHTRATYCVKSGIESGPNRRKTTTQITAPSKSSSLSP